MDLTSTPAKSRVPAHLGPTLLIGAFFLLWHAVHFVFYARGAEPSGEFVVLYYLCLAFLVLHWVRADKRRRGQSRVLDEGFFLYLAWPLVFPYYLFSTRGLRGGLTLLGIVALYFVAYGIVLAAWLVARGVGA
jgi:hypothetical protein